MSRHKTLKKQKGVNVRLDLYFSPELAICSVCGMKKELRPYGQNGALICFKCGMEDEEETRKQFLKQFK